MDKRLLSALFLAGRPFSSLYGLFMELRAQLYRRGLLRSVRLPLPVVSVGNLSMGGTGKTPMVIYLARLFQSVGRRPAILSRGYGGRSRQAVNLVSDGATLLMPPALAGDEPVLLAQSLPGVPVVTARHRALGGQFLVQNDMAEVIILDDGFQHLALARDVDLVLFATQRCILEERVFPGGMLREPWSALARAHVLVMTGEESVDEPLRAGLTRRCPGLPLLAGRYQSTAVYRSQGERLPVGSLPGGPLLAFCGLANPEAFWRSLEDRCELRGRRAFADHHPYTTADVRALVNEARALGCAGLITTEKDFVKIGGLPGPGDFPLWVLAVELSMEEGFERLILGRLGW